MIAGVISGLLRVNWLMITRHFADEFAADWIASWNAHDLSRILAHYTDDFEMSSPFISKMSSGSSDGSSGCLRGKEAVGSYWSAALQRMPELQFRLIDAYLGSDSICLHYHSVLGLRAVEWFWFNADRKVFKAMAHYDRLP